MCSKRIPPTIFESGNVNMFWPYVVGQSGTERPDSVDVTSPPATIRTSVAAATSDREAVEAAGSPGPISHAPSRGPGPSAASFCGQ